MEIYRDQQARKVLHADRSGTKKAQ